jgi:fatty-acyl-CoA synthase
MALISLLRSQVGRNPEASLVIDAGHDPPQIVSRGAFWRRVETLHAELVARGVRPGDCVATWLPNWSDALVWQFAAVAAGAHVIGINTRYNVEEVSHVLDRARPTLVAVAHGFLTLDLGRTLRAAVASSTAPKPSIAVIAGPHRDEPNAAACAGYDVGGGAWTPGAVAEAVPMTDDPDQLAVAFATSGSTGRPKLAAHSVAAVAMHAQASAMAGDWGGNSVTAIVLPLSGVFAFVPAMATIAAGGACLLEPVFEPSAIVADMERFRATHLVGGDDIVGRLFDAARDRPAALSSLSRMLIGDFNGRAEAFAGWAETTLKTVVSGVYGSSELFALTSLWPANEPAPHRWRGGGALVSPVLKVRAGDPETGAPLPAGQTGELQFQGYNVVDAYLGEPARRATVLTSDGWFQSGDLGIATGDREFEYLCRIGDALRLKGFLVEPAEIENRLAAHPQVRQTKVVGVRGADSETRAIGFVVALDGKSVQSADLLAWCGEALARYKVPHAIHVVEAMPVTSGVNGTKVRASVLREWAATLEQTSEPAPPRPQRGGTG